MTAAWSRFRRARWFLAIPLLLAIALAALIHLPAIQNSIWARVRMALATEYGLAVEASRFRVSPFIAAVELENLTVSRTDDDPNQSPAISADELAVDLDLWGLFARRITLDHAAVDGLDVRLEFDEDGGNNLTGPPPPANPGGGGWPVLIRDLQVDGRSLRVTDAARGLGIESPSWLLTVVGTEEEHVLVMQLAPGGRVEAAGFSLDLDEVRAEIGAESDAVRIDRFSMASPAGAVEATGTITGLAEPSVALEVRTDLDLAPVLAIAGVPVTAQGRLETRFDLSNRLGALEADGRTSGSAVRIEPVGAVDVDAGWNWNQATSALTLRDVSIDSGRGLFEGEGSIDLSGSGQNAVRLNFREVNLEGWAEFLQAPIVIASRLSGDFTGLWSSNDWPGITGDGTLEFTPTRSQVSPGVLPVSGSVRLRSTPDRLSADLAGIEAMSAIVDGRVALISRQFIAAELNALLPDMTTTATAAARFGVLTTTDSSTPLPAGSLRVEARVGGSLEAPTVDFGLTAPRTSIAGFRDIGVTARGSYDSGQVRIDSSTAVWDGQELAVEGVISLNSTAPELDLRARSDAIDIAAVLESLDLDIPASGVLSFDSAIRGPFDTPQVEVSVTGTDLEAYDQQLGTLDTRLELNRRFAEVTSLEWDRRGTGLGGVIRGDGRYGFQVRDFDFRLEGDQFEVNGLSPLSNGRVGGTVSFLLAGEGTPDSPRVNLEAGLEGAFYDTLDVGAVQIAGSWQGSDVELSVDLPDFNLNGQAQVQPVSPYPARLRIETPGFDLTRVVQFLPPNTVLSGSVRGAVEADGEIGNWEAARLRVELLDAAADYNGQPISTDRATLVYQNRRFILEPFTLIAGGQRLDISGDLPLDADVSEGRISVRGDLDLPSILEVAIPNQGVTGTGRIQLALDLLGSVANPRPDLELRWTDGSLAVPGLEPLTGVNLEVSSADADLVVERLTGDWRGARIQGSGRLPLNLVSSAFETAAVAQPATADLTISGAPFSAIPGLPTSIDGRADLRASLSATDFAIAGISGRLEMTNLDLQVDGLAFDQEQPVVATLAGGRVRVESFSFVGPQTRVAGSGELDLTPGGRVRADLVAQTDTLVLASASGGVESSGRLEVVAGVTGTLEAPILSGRINLENASIDLASPPIEARSVSASVNLGGERIVLESLSGSVNGGNLEARGSAIYRDGEVSDLEIDLALDQVFLEVPEGFRTLSTSRLQVRERTDLIIVDGSVEILEGAYINDLALDALLLEYVRGSGDDAVPEQPDPYLSRIRYDVDVDTVEPVVVDNNIALLEAQANLQLVGTYYRPGLTGRITIAEGGEIRIRESDFLVDQGVIDFNGLNAIEPSLDIVARTEAGGYDITLTVTGGGGTDLETTLTSEEPLPEPDIVSLLLTGRRLSDVRQSSLNVAREQALSYVTGSLDGRISESAEETLGLSRVRIEPNLIADESEAGPWLTLGQNLTRDLELIYSMNLIDSGEQIWIAEYDVRRQLITRGVKQKDNSYRLDLRHDLSFGGESESAGGGQTASPRTVGTVTVEPARFEDRDLLSLLDIDPGDRYSFFNLRRGTDRLREHFGDYGYLEAQVEINRLVNGDRVSLAATVVPGPRVEIVVPGSHLDRDAVDRVRDVWKSGGFDSLRAQKAVREIRTALVEQGYLQSEVDYTIAQTDDLKTVAFDIEPGDRYRRIRIDFEGMTHFEADELRSALEDADLSRSIHLDPNPARDLIRQRYVGDGYLDATVEAPRYELDPAQSNARVVLEISEGSAYRLSRVRVEGNRAIETASLAADFPEDGQPYRPEIVDLAHGMIEEQYWLNGYNDVVIAPEISTDPEDASVEIVFRVTENLQSRVAGVTVSGNRITNDSLALSQLAFEPGQALDFTRLNQTRRNLYNTGAYSMVALNTVPLEGAGEEVDSTERRVRVELNLREVPPYALKYGAFFDTENGPGLIADFKRRNWLGGARILGVSTRYDSDLQEFRTYFSQPPISFLPFKTNLTGFKRRELEEVFITDRTGVSIQQEAGLGNRFVLSFGYSVDRARTYDRYEPPPDDFLALPFDVTLNIARLSGTVSRDTRDDVLDATRGSFTSHAVEYGAEALGSDLALFKYFGQVFRYFPLSSPAEIPFSGGVSRPRLVYATGLRVGLLTPLGNNSVTPPNERFRAGGGTTVRGFLEDHLGPVDFSGDRSGNAVLIANNELRFPMVSIFDGVGFLDAGNVYERVGDFSLSDLRATAGFGVRVRTPYFLLRADYGFKLDRRVDEKAGTLFFSIGQAF